MEKKNSQKPKLTCYLIPSTTHILIKKQRSTEKEGILTAQETLNGTQKIVTLAAVGPHVKDYKAGQKVLVNFMDATETIVQDPVLKETELIMPAGSLNQQIIGVMRKVETPVEYYYKWAHDIMGEVLED